HHAPAVELAEVAGGGPAGGDAQPADRDVGHLPGAVQPGGPGILAAIPLEAVGGSQRGCGLDVEVHAVPAAGDAEVGHLGEQVGDVVGRGGEAAAGAAVADGARVAEVEPGHVPGQVDVDDPRRLGRGVEEGDADQLVAGDPGRQGRQARLGAAEVEGERALRRVDVAARPLAD